MNVRTFLQQNQAQLLSCRSEDTIQTVAGILSSNRIGAMPVCNVTGNLVGIISERDLVRGFAEKPTILLNLLVKDLMTAKVITCDLEMEMGDAMAIMGQHSIRHLPVIEAGSPMGMLSIRDCFAVQLQERELEASVLRDNVIAARYS